MSRNVRSVHRSSRTSHHSSSLPHFLLAIPLVLLPILLGGARIWFQAWVMALFCLGCMVWVWTGSKEGMRLPSGWVVAALGILACVPIIQALPVPMSVLEVISPERQVWLQRVVDILDVRPYWTSLSYAPVLTGFGLLWWVFCAVVVWMGMRQLKVPERSGWFFGLLLILAMLQASYGLFQVFVPQAGVLWAEYSGAEGCARGTFVNRNHYACFLNMLWPVLLAWVISLDQMLPRPHGMTRREHQEQVWHKKFLFGFLVGLVILALFFSRSRGGILAALVGLTVFLLLNRSKRAEMVIMVCAAWAVMFAYGWVIGFDEILARFDRIGSDTGRLILWEDVWHMITDHSWLGVGVNGFETIGRVYNTSLPESKFYYHAHNDYLQLMAEVGLPLALALILSAWTLWLVMARRVRRKAKDAQGPEALLAAGALAGCAAFLVHSVVEFNWQIPANQLYFLLMMGLAWVWSSEERGRRTDD